MSAFLSCHKRNYLKQMMINVDTHSWPRIRDFRMFAPEGSTQTHACTCTCTRTRVIMAIPSFQVSGIISEDGAEQNRSDGWLQGDSVFWTCSCTYRLNHDSMHKTYD